MKLTQQEAEILREDCLYKQKQDLEAEYKLRSDFDYVWEQLAIDKYSEIEELYEAKQTLNKYGHDLSYDEIMEIII